MTGAIEVKRESKRRIVRTRERDREPWKERLVWKDKDRTIKGEGGSERDRQRGRETERSRHAEMPPA